MKSGNELRTARTSLPILDAAVLEAMAGEANEHGGVRWPSWWPDDVDRGHVDRWLMNARSAESAPGEWGPRGIVWEGELIGHAGFHSRAESIDEALADPSYDGPVEPAAAGAVEIGYTVFPEHRGQGFASEVAAALVTWAASTGLVSTIIATVEPENLASARVLARVGGFRRIGTCADGTIIEDVYRCDLPSGRLAR